jgi:alpha-L-fucosidase
MRKLFVLFILSLLAFTVLFSQKKYEPSWESLTNRELSEWLIDAKFGIYAHWGVYSVPAYGSEWYAKRMYDKNNVVFKHHFETYDDLSKFGYKDFIPMFKTENYKPAEWADVISSSGARFLALLWFTMTAFCFGIAR